MRIERTKNAVRNIGFGISLKMYQIIMPFIMRTAILYFLGVKYLGLNSLFTSILQVLNLAELGVGSAMVYSMYRPIVEDNKEEICALMHLYRKYYRIIGFVVLCIGLVLLPFIPQLIEGEIPADINLYVLYILNLAATVLSYWLFAYKNCLLNAHQRVDILSKVMLVTNTIQYGLQLFVLYFFRNYYLFLIIALATQILTNIVTAVVVSRIYPEYTPRGEIDPKIVQGINRRIRDLFTSKLGAVILNSADTIVISAFLGLEMLAIYQNYFYILSSLIGLMAIVFDSTTAGIGNSIIVESKEKNYQDLKQFTFLIVWLAGFCTVSLLCLYQPFMRIWTGEKLMLGGLAVVCFCAYYYIYEINKLLNTYKDAAGLWHQDRFRPLVTALTNLILNVILVQFWGIYGVLLSTVIATLFVGMPWLLHNLFTTLFERKYLSEYVADILKYSFIVVGICIVTYLICQLYHGGLFTTFIVRGIICLFVANVLFYITLRKNNEFNKCVLLVDRITHHRFSLSKRLL